MASAAGPHEHAVRAPIAYVARASERPRYHANNRFRDVLALEPQVMMIIDARGSPTSLDAEGFVLVSHRSQVADFRDAAAVTAIHIEEIRQLLLARSGADMVTVSPRGILRFAERSEQSGRLDNSRPARFAHVDISAETARRFAFGGLGPAPDFGRRTVKRFAFYNIWRSFSGPPQDVPLAVCDGRSVADHDLVAADAVFDFPGQPEWSFEGWVVAHNPNHRWFYFRAMTLDEVILFKTADSAPERTARVPHVAFDDPSCPPGVPPRASIEMRGTAYWFA